MKHDWYPAGGGSVVGTIWQANPLTVALLKMSYVPNPDTHKVWSDVAAQEVTGAGYGAGGVLLTGKGQSYDAQANRNNLLAADSQWGPGATFQCGFAALYDNSGAKPLWSLVDFEGMKEVVDGVFIIDWNAVGLLYTVPVAG
jgi:hypothetical protein